MPAGGGVGLQDARGYYTANGAYHVCGRTGKRLLVQPPNSDKFRLWRALGIP